MAFQFIKNIRTRTKAAIIGATALIAAGALYVGVIKQHKVPQKQEPQTLTYTVKKGDNLWNIVKNNYHLTDPVDIADNVNLIADQYADEYPELKEDTLAYENGKLVRKADGIRGDKIMPGMQFELWKSNPQKKEAVPPKMAGSLESKLSQSDKKAGTSSSPYMPIAAAAGLLGLAGTAGYLRRKAGSPLLADYMKARGILNTSMAEQELRTDLSELVQAYNSRQSTDTYSWAPNKARVAEALNYARQKEGMKLERFRRDALTEAERQQILYQYQSGAKASDIIQQFYDNNNMRMSKSSLYRVVREMKQQQERLAA